VHGNEWPVVRGGREPGSVDVVGKCRLESSQYREAAEKTQERTDKTAEINSRWRRASRKRPVSGCRRQHTAAHDLLLHPHPHLIVISQPRRHLVACRY
jgi:hypothetical protein